MTREERILAYLPVACGVARRFFLRAQRADFEELRSIATLGLIAAVDKYDPARGPFLSFCSHTVTHAVLDWLRDQDPLTRLERRRLQNGEPVAEISFVPLTQKTGWATLDPGPPPIHEAMLSERREVLDRAIATLPARQQNVIRWSYFDGLTLREIGGRLGVNESRASQMHLWSLRKLRQALAVARIGGAEALAPA